MSRKHSYKKGDIVMVTGGTCDHYFDIGYICEVKEYCCRGCFDLYGQSKLDNQMIPQIVKESDGRERRCKYD